MMAMSFSQKGFRTLSGLVGLEVSQSVRNDLPFSSRYISFHTYPIHASK